MRGSSKVELTRELFYWNCKTNPGCHLQIRLEVQRSNLEKEVQAMHIVEVLAEACGIR